MAKKNKVGDTKTEGGAQLVYGYDTPSGWLNRDVAIALAKRKKKDKQDKEQVDIQKETGVWN